LCVKKHYPGWHQIYGGYWEGYRALADPAGKPYHTTGTPGLAAVLPSLPIAMRDAPSRPERSADRRSWPQKFARCSEGCEWIFTNWPRVYPSRKQFWERYHGWDLADVILDLGYVRPDGKTLIGQPALDLERLWTIEDIRRLKYAIKDPLLEQGRYLRYGCKNGGCGS
jgi:hypothetical protein